MSSESELEIMKVVAFIGAAYPRFELKKATIDVYANSLRDMDPTLLKMAAMRHIGLSEYFPTVAELRKQAAAIELEASGAPDWGEAWKEVQYAVRRHGFLAATELGLDKVFPDESIREAVKRVGWREICLSDIDGLNTLRAQFRDIYNAIVTRKEYDERVPKQVRDYTSKLAQKMRIENKLLLGDKLEGRDADTHNGVAWDEDNSAG